MLKAEIERDNSIRSIIDAQQGIHSDLEKVVTKHFLKPYLKPIADHTQKVFDQIRDKIEDELAKGVSLIFDSGCGTAMSTRIIATSNPSSLVIGIDRSAVRLAKNCHQHLPDNMILTQADCVDFWLLANRAGWKLDKHTLLFPNPYPKAKHVKRRWHAHPIFPTLLSLGGEIELRTNWKVYADEFCNSLHHAKKNHAVALSNSQAIKVETYKPEPPMTLFEKKYYESGQELYRVKTSL